MSRECQTSLQSAAAKLVQGKWLGIFLGFVRGMPVWRFGRIVLGGPGASIFDLPDLLRGIGMPRLADGFRPSGSGSSTIRRRHISSSQQEGDPNSAGRNGQRNERDFVRDRCHGVQCNPRAPFQI